MMGRCDAGEAAGVGVEGGAGDEDGAVLLLVVLQDGDEGAAYGEARAVQGVQEAGAAGGGAVAEIRAAGLEVLAVAAGGDLSVGALGGEPDLEVVGLGGGEAGVAGGEADDAVGQLEQLPEVLEIGR